MTKVLLANPFWMIKFKIAPIALSNSRTASPKEDPLWLYVSNEVGYPNPMKLNPTQKDPYPNTLPDPNPTCTTRLQDLVVENLDEE